RPNKRDRDSDGARSAATRRVLVDSARGLVAGHRRHGRGAAAGLRCRPPGLGAALRADAHRSGFIAPGGAVDARSGVAGLLDSSAAGYESRSNYSAPIRVTPMLFSKLSQLWRRLLFYIRRDRFNRELEEEMRFHLE